ncbi:MAG: ribonuclease Z [Candidatus Woesearchaeota archaeon]
MEITFLGTSSMVPTKDRNVQGIYLEYNGEGILFDCGEGTQRQMNIAGINRHKVKKIFISHWHGDHVSGLVGLIQTIGNSNNPGKLSIFGPKDTKEFMNNLLNSCIFDLRIELEVFEFDLEKKDVVFECDDYFVEASPMTHGVPCLAYSFIETDRRRMNSSKLKELGVVGVNIGKLQRGESVIVKNKTINPDDVSSILKGKKISFVFDTSLNDNISDLVENSDLLIGEATYDSSKENKAEEYNHMTAEQMAFIASNSNVKKLVLTHFSQRYKTLHDLEKEAKDIFPNTVMAYDFLKLKI